MFSDREPTNRCAGFTQGGLSHLWQTSIPRGGSSPVAKNTESREAIHSFPFTLMRPYPLLSLAAIQGQHSSEARLSTFVQKRAARSGETITNLSFAKTFASVQQ